jgi:hypothetical protein
LQFCICKTGVITFLRIKFFKKALAARSLPIPLPRQKKNTNYAASGRSSAMLQTPGIIKRAPTIITKEGQA